MISAKFIAHWLALALIVLTAAYYFFGPIRWPQHIWFVWTPGAVFGACILAGAIGLACVFRWL